MLTVKQFLRGAGKYYAANPSKNLSSIEALAWSAAEELASFAEMTFEPHDLHQAAPNTYMALWGLESYFKEIGHLPSQAHGLMMLLIERANWGLTAREDDTKRP